MSVRPWFRTTAPPALSALAALVAAGAAVLLALAPAPVSAHATILSSTPRPGETLRTAPGVVVLAFSERLDVHLSRAAVVAPRGQRFVQGSVSEAEIRVPLTANEPGLYRVSWTSVSAADGHALSGGFRFGVNVPASGVAEDAPLPAVGDLALAGVRALEYAGLLMAVGLLLLLELSALAPRLPWVRAALPVALAAGALAGLATVTGEALLATGAPAPDRVASYLVAGVPGWMRLGRVAAEAAALLVSLRWRRPAALPLGLALAGLAAAGHAAAVEPAPLGVAVAVVHLVSAGLWAGGILALAVQRPPGGWLSRDGRRLLARFSPVALAAFPVTAATGVIQATEELSGLGDLVASTYGRVLSLKSLAVVLMLPLSVLAWRRLLAVPRAEAALALVAVGASGLLAAFPLPPARLQEAQVARAGPDAVRALPGEGDLTLAGAAGDVLVGLTLRPGTPGRNTAWLYVLPIGGEQAASGLRVVVTAAGRAAAVRRCGPACRSADIDVGGGDALVVGVGTGSATFHVPSLPAPDARALVERAQRRMHELRTFRLDETLLPAAAPVSVAYAFQAPDRLSYRGRGGAETVIVGPTEYSRDGPRERWRSQTLPPVTVPSFVWDGARAVSPRELAPVDLDGRALRVVSFFEDLDGVPVWFELTVDDQGLVERAAMRAQGHFMTHRYHDFDGPLTIVPPVG